MNTSCDTTTAMSTEMPAYYTFSWSFAVGATCPPSSSSANGKIGRSPKTLSGTTSCKFCLRLIIATIPKVVGSLTAGRDGHKFFIET